MDAYCQIPLEDRGKKLYEIGKLIREWEKANKFAKYIWKRKRRKALNSLAEQLDKERATYNKVIEPYSNLKQYCQQADKDFQKPERTLRDKNAKLNDLRYIATDEQYTDLIDWVPDELKRLADEIKNKLNEGIRKLEGRLKKSQETSRVKGGEFTEWMEKEAKARVFKSARAEEASLAEFGHMLEALDPKHRDYQRLAGVYEIWRGEDTTLDFFTWVSAYERREGKPLHRTRYLTDAEQRKKYKLGFKGIQPYYIEREPKKSEEPTEEKKQPEKKELQEGIYVMTPEKEFYARRESLEREKTSTTPASWPACPWVQLER